MSRELEIPHPVIGRLLDRWLLAGHPPPRAALDGALQEYVKTLPLCPPAPKDPGTDPVTTSSLRVGLFTRWTFPHRGGLSTYIETLSRGLQQRGHQVEVISQSTFGERWSRVKQQVKPSVRKAYAGYHDEAQELLRAEYGCCTYERLLLEWGLPSFDVVHAHDLFTANILLRQRGLHGAPVVYTPHGIMTDRKTERDGVQPRSAAGIYHRLLDHVAASCSQRLLVLYEAFAQRLAAYGADARRTAVVYTGIDEQPAAAPAGDHETVVISYVGRLTESKGPQLLLQAWQQLGARRHAARVQLIGAGPLERQLRQRMRRWRLPRIRLLGHRTDVPRLLAASDILVVPGVNESFPLAMLEGMMAGVAVVASECGGIPEAIEHQKTGLLFPPGDSRALAKHLQRLIAAPRLRQRLAQAARETACQRFTADRMVSEIASAYRTTLARAGEPACQA